MTQVLIIGATSAIARGCAYAWAKRGQPLLLAGRDMAELERLASDIQLRFQVSCAAVGCDLDALPDAASWCAELEQRFGRVDGVLMAAGWMAERHRHPDDWPLLMQRNVLGPVALLDAWADLMASRKLGFIVAISSVAGDRGRQSNYHYGAAKAALTAYLSGLRQRLFVAGVPVLTVKPGFVDTRMTWGLPGLFAVADPMWVGEHIVQAQQHGRDCVYVPSWWRVIMWVIRSIPERLFKRLTL